MDVSGQENSTGNEGGIRVLVVEDDLFFAARILSVLKKSGYEVLTASQEADALHQARHNAPALIILNLASPKLGGLSLIREIKSLTAPPKVLAFLSHVKIPDIREEARAAGTDKLCANSAISLRLPSLVESVLRGDGPAEED